MKLRSIVLTISLLANGALATALVLHVTSAPVSAPAATSSTATNPAADRIDPETWKRLDSSPEGLIARLRAEGFPLSVLQMLVRLQVEERLKDRYQALNAAQGRRPYWSGDGRYSTDPKLNAQRRALGREAEAMRRELLGPEGSAPSADQLASWQRRFGPIPAAKAEPLQRIIADYNDLTKEVTDVANGTMLPQDRAAVALLQKEREADIAKLLSPTEMTEYEMHHSSTANRLHAQLSAFNPTEQEFRALFEINRAIDSEYGNPGALSVEQRRARAAAQKALNGQIQEVLGPERYAAYEQAIDPNYQQAYQLVSRLELPVATAGQITAVQKDIMQRSNALVANRTLSTEQRQLQIAVLQQEATAKLTSALGSAGFEAYKSSGWGGWVESLKHITDSIRPAPPVVTPKP